MLSKFGYPPCVELGFGAIKVDLFVEPNLLFSIQSYPQDEFSIVFYNGSRINIFSSRFSSSYIERLSFYKQADITIIDLDKILQIHNSDKIHSRIEKPLVYYSDISSGSSLDIEILDIKYKFRQEGDV